MRIKITTCPKKVKLFPVSLITRPVTLTALVAVNAASTHVIPVVVALGNFSNRVPTAMRKRKLPAKTMEGFILLLAYNFSLNSAISMQSRRTTFVIKREEAKFIESIKLNPCNMESISTKIVNRGKRPLKNGFHFSLFGNLKKSNPSNTREIIMITK